MKNRKSGSIDDDETRGVLRMVFGILAAIMVVLYYVGTYFAFFDVE
jgi:hypothetical protein